MNQPSGSTRLELNHDQSMQMRGNKITNLQYNPQGIKMKVPIDANNDDYEIEKFIRQKYDQKSLVSSRSALSGPQLTATSLYSNDDSFDQSPRASERQRDAPQLNSKKSTRKFTFGLRSTSSIFPQKFRSEKTTLPLSPAYTGPDDNDRSAKANKQSRVLGSNIVKNDDDFDAKLAQLREMGFRDSRQNSNVLKEVRGDVDRAIEQLVTVQEGSRSARVLTPVSATADGTSSTLSVNKVRTAVNAVSNNPFDAMLSANVPQRSATAPVLQSTPVASQGYNPFLQQSPQHQSDGSLQQSFQSMQLSQPAYQHPIAPQAQPLAQQHTQYNHPQMLHQSHTGYSQPSSNPFLINSATYPPPMQFTQHQPSNMSNVQYTESPTQMHAQPTGISAEPLQGHYGPYMTTQLASNPGLVQQQTGVTTLAPSNPFAQQMTATFTGVGSIPQQSPLTQQSMPQPSQISQPQLSQRLDKSSILALYNTPHNYAAQPFQVAPMADPQMNGYQPHAATMPSYSSPISSRNPFAT